MRPSPPAPSGRFLRTFDDAAAFLDHAGPFLTEREAENNLPLGVAAVVAERRDAYAGGAFLATVEQAATIVLAAVMTPPHNLILSATEDLDALDPLAERLHVRRPGLPGVVGPAPLSGEFADRWCHLTAQSAQRVRALRTFQLETVRPTAAVAGRLRRASVADRALLVSWLHAFAAEAVPEDVARVERAVDLRLAGDQRIGGYFFWEDGQPVSLVGYGGPTPNGIRIGPVFTPPRFRRRGYASTATAAVSQWLLDGGRRFCFLFTDVANPTANRIYEQIGYELVGEFEEYRFGDRHGEGDAPSPP